MLVTVRHGETNYNKNRVCSGQGDVPRLTEEAHTRAYELGKQLVKYNLDLAIISPLTRAQETFFEINKSINISHVKDPLLIERDFKEYEGKSLNLLDSSKYWNIKHPCEYDIEPIDTLINRVAKCLLKIKKEYPNKNILIVAHSGICRAIKYIIEGKKVDSLYSYEMDNLHVNVFEEW